MIVNGIVMTIMNLTVMADVKQKVMDEVLVLLKVIGERLVDYLVTL